MTFLMWWTIALLAWVMIEIDLRMWGHPARVRALLPSGPVAGPLRLERPTGVVYMNTPYVAPPAGPWLELELAPAPEHVGATEDWSPRHAAAEAELGMLPLDDVDEWLATRACEYEHALSRIGCRTVSLVRGETQCTVDEELAAFVDGSQMLHAYRELRIGSTGEFTPRQAMQLEALLAA